MDPHTIRLFDMHLIWSAENAQHVLQRVATKQKRALPLSKPDASINFDDDRLEIQAVAAIRSWKTQPL